MFAKKFFSGVLISGLLITQVQAQAFGDVFVGDEYAPAITYVSDRGIFEGYSDGSFGANQNINRAELVKVLMEAADAQGNGSYCFTDVAVEWFAKYVCMAKDHGMLTGYPDGSFRPAQPVSYVEAAALLVREYDGMLPQAGETWYMPYTERLAEWGGVPPTVQNMNSSVTRGEVAYMLWKTALAHQSPIDPIIHSPEREGLKLTMSSDVTQVKPGESVTYTISVKNRDDRDDTIDITATADAGLRMQSATSGVIQGNTVSWRNVDIEAGEKVTFTLVATTRISAKPGTSLRLRVSAEDEDEDVALTVQGVPFATTLGDPVIYWNNVALKANATDHTGTYGAAENGGPGKSSRALAIVQAAVYDAVNSIDGSYKPYISAVTLPVGAKVSVDSAVAYAAHHTLSALYPKQRAEFDVALQAHLNQVPSGNEKTLGQMIGETVAQNILNARANDGSELVDQYTPNPQPGHHREDPLNPSQGFLGVRWGSLRTFAIQSSTQFRAAPPPALTSAEYATAFNEVKVFGGNGTTTPTVRTQDQTNIAMFWMYDGSKKIGTPPRLFNQIVQVIAQQKGNNVVENARLFALVNLAMADAGISCWDSKYLYDFWRPIIGIREADAGTGQTGLGDGNAATVGDTTWTPLGSAMSNMAAGNNFTPAFPAYPSGHATFGAAAFRTLENFYGTDAIPFTFVSDELNGVTVDSRGQVRPYAPRSFARLSDASRENAQSRIYLGVHWQFDATAGMTMGTGIADYITRTTLLPQ